MLDPGSDRNDTGQVLLQTDAGIADGHGINVQGFQFFSKNACRYGGDGDYQDNYPGGFFHGYFPER
jgi:hypothetical protein